MTTQTETQSGGAGFLGLLTILFIGLRLTDFIDWSWWWVLSPILIPLGLIASVLLAITAWHLPQIIWAAIKYCLQRPA